MFLPAGKAPIHYAVEKNNELFVVMLRAAGADCDLRVKDTEWKITIELVIVVCQVNNPTPIEMAAILRLDGIFNLLLKEVGVHPRPDKEIRYFTILLRRRDKGYGEDH